MVSKPNSVEKSKSQSSSFKTILKMGLTKNAPWPEDNTDDFLDLIYWSRQIFGILLGVVWGIIPLTGILGLVLFAGINAGAVYLYSLNYQNIDEELYGGIYEVVKEGFMTSFAGFLVTWIIFYTGLHFQELGIERTS
ncbi:unnamed protein product [Diamesa serratosioi]